MEQIGKALYLDNWIEKKHGIGLTAENLQSYQLRAVQDTLAFAVEHSVFYRERFGAFQNRVSCLQDLAQLPFTAPADLVERGSEMACVPQSQISRIVTFQTSGTTGNAKRIFFTEEDQELTIDYFHHGMQFMTVPKDKVLILMPAKRPGSVGILLSQGLQRLGAQTVPYGIVETAAEYGVLAHRIKEDGVTSIVGLPEQVLKLAEVMEESGSRNRLETVLLSADYVSEQAVQRIAEIFGCSVFEHYGMTEMGLGCAMSCIGRDGSLPFDGYHIRENDLYIEIVNPKTGEPVPEGSFGEIVFTTLTRKGMPFIRYRTGDVSRILPQPCHCGSILRRLDKVGHRKLVKGSFNQ